MPWRICGGQLSQVGNRVSSTDLLKSQTLTLSFGCASNISRIAASPDGAFLLAVDDAGRASSVAASPSTVEFSPNGFLIVVVIGKHVQNLKSPGCRKELFSF